MMKKLTCYLVAVVLLSSMLAPISFAFSEKTHNTHLELVLFGDRGLSTLDEKTATAFDCLAHAAWLCIDQYQGKGQDSHLRPLRNQKFFRIHGLPKNVSEISYTSNYAHRIFTHKGWNYDFANWNSSQYPNWPTQQWPLRKKILQSTVEAIFNFRHIPFVIQSKQGDAFCALVYYTHILGDHIAFDCSTYHKEYDFVIPLAGGTNDVTLIRELLDIFPILFPNQEGNAYYTNLRSELECKEKEIYSLLNNPSYLRTPEGFDEYHKHAEELLNILAEYVPKLLQNESYFTDVFGTSP